MWSRAAWQLCRSSTAETAVKSPSSWVKCRKQQRFMLLSLFSIPFLYVHDCGRSFWHWSRSPKWGQEQVSKIQFVYGLFLFCYLVHYNVSQTLACTGSNTAAVLLKMIPGITLWQSSSILSQLLKLVNNTEVSLLISLTIFLCTQPNNKLNFSESLERNAEIPTLEINNLDYIQGEAVLWNYPAVSFHSYDRNGSICLKCSS